MGYIYLRTNLVNGKKYVGQAKDIKKRNNEWNCLNGKYGGYVINNARKKYGADGFSFEILKECPNEEMNYWEMYYVKMYNSKKPYGYNMTDGGDSAYEKSEETRKKISDALRGRKRPDIAAAKRGKKRPAEVVEKVAAAQRGKPKPKVSAARRGMKLSEETRKKMSEAHRGKPKSPEHVAKVAAANSKPIQGLDKITGEVVFTFPSAAEAERQYGFSSRHIAACCRGERKSHKGYIWRYAV